MRRAATRPSVWAYFSSIEPTGYRASEAGGGPEHASRLRHRRRCVGGHVQAQQAAVALARGDRPGRRCLYRRFIETQVVSVLDEHSADRVHGPRSRRLAVTGFILQPGTDPIDWVDTLDGHATALDAWRTQGEDEHGVVRLREAQAALRWIARPAGAQYRRSISLHSFRE